ncbi:uncharacterized protein LOC117639412 [Thrips palmi]|uniref:Uncharacterized protein LOC117639412 n=1 Tax=Thrips palmi TaxID=161013 RepID=A0A6P8Y4H7_THRPL|nr:uncharacterized protein LOC117639412 [Thrips palmi]
MLLREVALLLLLVTTAKASLGSATSLRWELFTGDGNLPNDAVVGGYQKVNNAIKPHYIARAFNPDGGVIPIAVCKSSDDRRWLGWGAWNDGEGSAASIQQYEVACVDKLKVRWVPAVAGNLPDGAVPAGVDAKGQNLYACRSFDSSLNPKDRNHFMMMTPGVLLPYSGACKVNFFGVKSFSTYEVLVVVDD